MDVHSSQALLPWRHLTFFNTTPWHKLPAALRVQEARQTFQDAVPVVTRGWVEECARQKAQVSSPLFDLGFNCLVITDQSWIAADGPYSLQATCEAVLLEYCISLWNSHAT